MDYRQPVIKAFIKILERADAFRHGHEELFAKVSLTEIHCIDWVGSIDHANVTKIADTLGMTRGGVSKVLKRLQCRGYIQNYQEAGNKKEIYFRLSEQGVKMYEAHKQSHLKANQEKERLLEFYSVEEQKVILRFLNEMRQLMDKSLPSDG